MPRKSRIVMLLGTPASDHPPPIVVNVQKVQKLKIIVTSDDLLDLGKHLALADARVSK